MDYWKNIRNFRKKSGYLDLERDLETKPEDIKALKQVKTSRKMSFDAYLGFLESLGDIRVTSTFSKKSPKG